MPIEDMSSWEDGVYPRTERCPHCGSTNTSVAIHGAIRQWWCQDCGQPFMPKELDNAATIRCWGCRQRVNLVFHRVYTPVKEHWEGTCPSCGTKNYIYRPFWDDQLPIFRKYTRGYLSQVTGYSRGYLGRVARGKSPLKQAFIDNCCSTLGESEEVLFQPEAPQGCNGKAVTYVTQKT